MKILTALKKQFDITHSRKSVITGVVVTALLLVTVAVGGRSFLGADFSLHVLLFIGCLAASFFIGALIAFPIRIRNPLAARCVQTALLFLLPIVTITMTEALGGVFVYDMTYAGFLGNYLLILLLTGILYAVSGSYRLPILILNPVLFCMALVNHWMLEFRGTPFVPMDFFSITVADTILEQYTYVLDYQIVTAVVLLAFLVVVGVRMHTPAYRTPAKLISRITAGVVPVTLLLLFYCTSLFSGRDVTPDFWNQARGYRNYGFAYSFFLNTKYLYTPVPAGYDAEAVEGYVETMLDGEEPPEPAAVQPDVICIMNESLSDLSVLGDLAVNRECMPFISSLRENTVRGNLYVPVIGAGTANTEFEFLTGHSMAFLPSGSNAYILYVKQHLETLAAHMQTQNYTVGALHPYYRHGWNRDNVYPLLGFPGLRSLEDLFPMDIFAAYQQNADIEALDARMRAAYPDETILLRQYVRDDYDYQLLIEDYENRDPSKPYFMFNVTMQNHGGYRRDAENFTQEIHLTNTTAYPETNRYLSLLKYSDDAFRELITYFESVERPVVICMFGDHQPSIEEAFVEEMLGTNIGDLDIEQQQKRHMTPFLIWANYDIEEREIEGISVNYLSSLLLKTAGLKMSAYNRYLLKLSETLPVIDTVGYIDAACTHYSWTDSSPYSELLEQYRRLQYNALLDTDHRKMHLFTVN